MTGSVLMDGLGGVCFAITLCSVCSVDCEATCGTANVCMSQTCKYNIPPSNVCLTISSPFSEEHLHANDIVIMVHGDTDIYKTFC